MTWQNEREHQVVVTFVADYQTAQAVADRMRQAVEFMVSPTKEAASALFHLGCEAVAIAAEAERDREKNAA